MSVLQLDQGTGQFSGPVTDPDSGFCQSIMGDTFDVQKNYCGDYVDDHCRTALQSSTV